MGVSFPPSLAGLRPDHGFLWQFPQLLSSGTGSRTGVAWAAPSPPPPLPRLGAFLVRLHFLLFPSSLLPQPQALSCLLWQAPHPLPPAVPLALGQVGGAAPPPSWRGSGQCWGGLALAPVLQVLAPPWG